MANIGKQLTISGKVIGVNFRNWAQREASRLGLGGWVRNNTDLTVSLEIEGPEDTIQQFIEAVERGPEGAQVDSVDVRDTEYHGYSDFSVQY